LDEPKQALLIEELKSLDDDLSVIISDLSIEEKLQVENEESKEDQSKPVEVETIKQDEIEIDTGEQFGNEGAQIENLKPSEVESNSSVEDEHISENTNIEEVEVKTSVEEEFKKEAAEKILDLDINTALNDITDEVNNQAVNEEDKPVEEEPEIITENTQETAEESKPVDLNAEQTSKVQPLEPEFKATSEVQKEPESNNETEVISHEEIKQSQIEQVPEKTGDAIEQIIAEKAEEKFNFNDCGYGKIDFSLFYDQNRSKLSLTVHSAENLINVDKKSLSDPYAKVLLLPDGQKKSKRKTLVIKDNLNPSWEETFEWTMTQAEAKSKTLQIELKDEKSIFTKQDTVFLGQLALPLEKEDIYTSSVRKSLWLQPESNLV